MLARRTTPLPYRILWLHSESVVKSVSLISGSLPSTLAKRPIHPARHRPGFEHLRTVRSGAHPTSHALGLPRRTQLAAIPKYAHSLARHVGVHLAIAPTQIISPIAVLTMCSTYERRAIFLTMCRAIDERLLRRLACCSTCIPT